LVCNRESEAGVSGEDASYFEDEPKENVIVGTRKSGNRVTLETWVIEDSDYDKLKKIYRRGSMAINIILENKEASCIFYVSGLNSSYMKLMNLYGDQLRLVEISDYDFNDFSYNGYSVYEFIDIPQNIYPKLHDDETETVTVKALLVTSMFWKKRGSVEQKTALTESIAAALQNIRANVKDDLLGKK